MQNVAAAVSRGKVCSGPTPVVPSDRSSFQVYRRAAAAAVAVRARRRLPVEVHSLLFWRPLRATPVFAFIPTDLAASLRPGRTPEEDEDMGSSTTTSTPGPSGRGRRRLRYSVRTANLTLIRVIPDYLQACAGTALMALLERHAGASGCLPVGPLASAETDQTATSADDDTLCLFGQEEAA